MDKLHWKFITAVLAAALIGVAHTQVASSGRRPWKWCFVCSGKTPDRECESFPQYVANGRINCTRRYCTSTVKYDVKHNSLSFDDKGISETARPLTPKDLEVVSIARNCEDLPRGNRCVRDSDRSATFTCYSTCLQDYCNAETRAPTWSDLNINRLKTFAFNDTRAAPRQNGPPEEALEFPLRNSYRNQRPPIGFADVTRPEFLPDVRPGFPGRDSEFRRTIGQRIPRTETLGVRPPHPVFRPSQFRPNYIPSNRNANTRLVPELNHAPPDADGPSRSYVPGDNFRQPDHVSTFQSPRKPRPNYGSGPDVAGQPIQSFEPPPGGHALPPRVHHFGFPADPFGARRELDPMPPTPIRRTPIPRRDQYPRTRNVDGRINSNIPPIPSGGDANGYDQSGYGSFNRNAPSREDGINSTYARSGEAAGGLEELETTADGAEGDSKDKDVAEKRSRLAKEFGKKSRMDNKRGEPLYSKEASKAGESAGSSSDGVALSLDVIYSVFIATTMAMNSFMIY